MYKEVIAGDKIMNCKTEDRQMDRTNQHKEEQRKTMKRLMNRMHGGQKGFTLIELLVVIAILGVIAAVVALNVGGFFGRGTLQAANTELHQAQTAIIAAMADGQTGQLSSAGVWQGQEGVVYVVVGSEQHDASDYIYGPLRAAYTVSLNGTITTGDSTIDGGWGLGIIWDTGSMNWRTRLVTDPQP